MCMFPHNFYKSSSSYVYNTPNSYHVNSSTVQKKKSIVFCANCGGQGHVYRTCNHPIISYGVICFRMYYDSVTNSIYPKYLMVQRKDSLSYVEFIRGKYDLQNKSYICKLFSGMTNEERDRIKLNDFDTLWNSMWCRGSNQGQETNTRNFNKEFKEAREKFDVLRKGYKIISYDSKEEQFVDVSSILDGTSSDFDETEWGFPKGRRNINEDDMSCAFREFKEETGINGKQIKICHEFKPLEEVFTGSNKIRYKHVYYIAKFNGSDGTSSLSLSSCSASSDAMFDPDNKIQTKEVKDVKWFSYQDAQEKIRGCNVERKELFKRLNHILMKTMQ